MQQLSQAIFTTNIIDLKLLRDTLHVQGADDAVFQSVTKAQLRRFCRRSMNPKAALVLNLQTIFKFYEAVEGRALLAPLWMNPPPTVTVPIAGPHTGPPVDVCS